MKNVLEYLEKTAADYPNKKAIVSQNATLTFSELLLLSQKVGTFLSSFAAKEPVALLMDKEPNCVCAMMGALYANCYYVVVDVNSPSERIKTILGMFDHPLLITDIEHEELAKTINGNYCRYEDIIQTDVDKEILVARREAMCDMDTAYILFTSGSTGQPKGTVISHRALISYLNWVTNEFRFNSNTVFGSQTPLYFSMSVTDLFSTIKCGCTYCIIPKQYFSFPMNLIKYLNEQKVNTIYWVPTALSILANWKVFDVVKPEYLECVLFAGEVMPTKQLNYWISSLSADVIYANLFGPTETTDICTFYRVNRSFSNDESIPIGTHCDNCDAFVINDSGKIAKNGEEGELYVRSSFMADGYYKNMQKTSEAFVQNPIHSNYPEIVYRTGDIVRYNERGELLYICRKDSQIKRMGYRIELGEIEASVNSLAEVKSCACIYDKEQDVIVLIFEGNIDDKQKIMEAIASKCPSYMTPDRVLRTDNMPLNMNGKINRKYLLTKYKDYKEV